MAKHAKLSPSASERWLNCPGSVSLSETVPRHAPSKYATEGTAAHSLLECYLMGNDTSMDFIEADGEKIPVTKEMRDAVLVASNYILSYADAAQIWSEERVCADSIDTGLWGSTDAAIWHESIGMLEIIDYKHGKGVAVEVIRNSQLRIYAIGFVDTHIGNWDDVEYIKYTIIQPRAQHPKGDIRSEMLSAAAVQAFTIDTKAAIALTKVNDPVLKEGDWCRWCPVAAAGVCPEKNNQATRLFSKIEEATLYPIGIGNGERLAKFMDMVPRIEAWCKQISAAAKQSIEHGDDVPGWKVVDGRATRQWKDEAEATVYFMKQLKTKAYAPLKLKSPAQMERLISREAVNERCDKISTTTALVPSSDQRPAKQFKPLFEALS